MNINPATSIRRSAPKALLSAVLATCALLMGIAKAYAEFSVNEVTASIKNEEMLVDFDLDLALSDQAEEALLRGIPLIITIEVELERDRPLMWDTRITSWERHVEISYHALSERYLVQETGRGEIQNFLNLSTVMNVIGKQRSLKIPVPQLPTNPEINYQVKVRAHLDSEALPTPLRLMAYLSPSWRLSTGWTPWPVQH